MPKLLPRQYAKMLYELTQSLSEKDITPVVDVFFEYLKREQVTSKSEQIIDEFILYSDEKVGNIPLKITTAHKLSKKELDSVVTQFGGGAIEERIDDTIGGGIIIKKGNTVFDASITTQINRLKRQLM